MSTRSEMYCVYRSEAAEGTRSWGSGAGCLPSAANSSPRLVSATDGWNGVASYCISLFGIIGGRPAVTCGGSISSKEFHASELVFLRELSYSLIIDP